MKQKSPLIMHVEDDDDHATLVSAAVTENKMSCDIIRFSDAESGLDYLCGHHQSAYRHDHPFPDLILLDLSLPGMSGLDFLKHLKSEQQTRSIPVVVLSISDQKKQIALAYRLGANSYIVKPDIVDDLIVRLAEMNMYWFGTAEMPRMDVPTLVAE